MARVLLGQAKLRYDGRVTFPALGIQTDYVDFMMGHTISTYHDIQSKGVEFLRNLYTTAGLSIAPKPKGLELDALKAFARGLGLEPEKVLARAAFTEPHRAYVTMGTERKPKRQSSATLSKSSSKRN